jgi:hypothetical protein
MLELTILSVLVWEHFETRVVSGVGVSSMKLYAKCEWVVVRCKSKQEVECKN